MEWVIYALHFLTLIVCVALVWIFKYSMKEQVRLNQLFNEELKGLNEDIKNLQTGLAEAADWAHQQDLFQQATLEKNARLRERLAQLIRIDRGIEDIPKEKETSNVEEAKTEES